MTCSREVTTWLQWWDCKEAACALTTWWRGRDTDAVLGPSQLVLKLSECQYFSPTVLRGGQSVYGFSGVSDPPYPGALTSCSWPYHCSPLLGEVTQYPGDREPHPQLKLTTASLRAFFVDAHGFQEHNSPSPLSDLQQGERLGRDAVLHLQKWELRHRKI